MSGGFSRGRCDPNRLYINSNISHQRKIEAWNEGNVMLLSITQEVKQ